MPDAHDPGAAVDQAAATLYGKVYHPHFFAKCAEAGFAPADAREADMMLQMGARLFADYQGRLADAAQKRAGFYDVAAMGLDQALGTHDGRDVAGHQKWAASRHLTDPAIVAAALALTAPAA